MSRINNSLEPPRQGGSNEYHNLCFEPHRRGGSNEYPESMFWAEIWKISDFFNPKTLFLVVKFSIYLNRPVFVMICVISEKKKNTKKKKHVWPAVTREYDCNLHINKCVWLMETFWKWKTFILYSVQLNHVVQQNFVVANIEETLSILEVYFLHQHEGELKTTKESLKKSSKGKIQLHKRKAQNTEIELGRMTVSLCTMHSTQGWEHWYRVS